MYYKVVMFRGIQFDHSASVSRSWELERAETGAISTVCYTHDRDESARVHWSVRYFLLSSLFLFPLRITWLRSRVKHLNWNAIVFSPKHLLPLCMYYYVTRRTPGTAKRSIYNFILILCCNRVPLIATATISCVRGSRIAKNCKLWELKF